ncbi:phosphatidylserine/phosphatidylglycerophosphate/cardiolipin synthase family protein [Oceanicoccus sp. KOV_DT_Chl]|uniref:phospholipase D-like domain-containing protein n=1 Tax=Oceanicoccus sp. KOV_DT_Chl TaxID=1904639 RepID=UPI000C7C91A0|nr:phosphatidylserine/phosphatidylglycerophosphate/cardiolipin synthase family protein [Oceanicoccus sp. KOV_DT_Chl]
MTTTPAASKQSSNSWQTETIFDSAREHFDSMLAGINQASQSIELAIYIFELDVIGKRFVDHLQRAAQRGVTVRVLVDGIGSSRSADTLGELLTGAGAEFRIYHPLPWYWDSYRWSLRHGSWISKFWHFINVVNRRDHRKFMVIDNHTAWCGNFNLSDDHLGARLPWRDYGVCVSGRPITQLQINFDRVWQGEEAIRGLTDFKYSCSNLSFRLRWLRNRNLIARIRNAQQRIWICSAYFSPSGAILRAIKAARNKNIDVRLIVAGRSDVALFPLLTSSYYADLLKLGVKIYQYEHGVLHAKVILVDQHCVIGSTNLNHRSFYHDLELDVVLDQTASITRMENLLLSDMDNARLINSRDVSILSRSFWLGWVPRILRYWM